MSEEIFATLPQKALQLGVELFVFPSHLKPQDHQYLFDAVEWQERLQTNALSSSSRAKLKTAVASGYGSNR